MRIDPKDELAGLPIVEVRDFLRGEADIFSADRVAYKLKVEKVAAEGVIEELLRRGYLEDRGVMPDDGRPVFATTIAGNAFKMASAAKPVKRATAERVLREFLERVRELPTRDEYLYVVDRVILFGSMLDEQRETVNDIDLVLGLEHKHPARRVELDRAYSDAAIERGRNFRSDLEYLFAAELDTKKFLKKGSRLLNFHRPDDEILTQVPQRVIYGSAE